MVDTIHVVDQWGVDRVSHLGPSRPFFFSTLMKSGTMAVRREENQECVDRSRTMTIMGTEPFGEKLRRYCHNSSIDYYSAQQIFFFFLEKEHRLTFWGSSGLHACSFLQTKRASGVSPWFLLRPEDTLRRPLGRWQRVMAAQPMYLLW